MKKKTTLADVAAAANVSKMTASRALRGAKDVSASSVEIVRRAAQDLGYVGNHLAASLSSQRSELIGAVVPNLSNVVFAQVLSGISDGIAGSGIRPVFGVTDYSEEKEYDIIRSMLSWRPAGLIVTGLDQAPATRRLLENADIPVVQIMDNDGDPVDSCVGFSHQQAGGAIAEALIEVGFRRFGYIGCGLELDKRAAKRRFGFEAALKRHGLEFLASSIAEGLSSIPKGRERTAAVLKQQPDLDCLYFSNDDVAVGGLFHCIDAGISVPDQLALAGFNGLDVADGFPGRIATSRTQRNEIGRIAAQLVLEAAVSKGDMPSQNIVFVPEVDLGNIS
ncbi:LacI family DNA-binding transcriptional regulator [Roseibium algae]|uniref:LacI family DNA-binding transcriptional regulator n=1 Tax=Roseibium algae TaxID=3123038 RepID=A0ABU8TJS8_9HYPH